MKTMTQEEFMSFYTEWLGSDRKLRLGQAFVHEVYKRNNKLHGFHDPYLFYNEDYNEAFTIIVRDYLKD